MKHILPTVGLLCAAVASASTAHAADIVATDSYRWHGDTITQGEFMATAPSEYHIVSNYSAQPGYRFPIAKEWKVKNDLSAYPHLTTPNRLHAAIYNMGLDEMVNAVEPDTTLRTGKEWAGVWTRDVSYSILLSMAYLQPEASRISLQKKVNSRGVIVQDTGSGGAWPVSSDREIWALAAFEVYKVTGDRKWLEYIYPVIVRSLADDALTVAGDSGLVKGETSFIDWREQSYPRWMQSADIYSSEALSTSVVHSAAYAALAEMAQILGHKKDAEKYALEAERIASAINEHLWLDDKGYYAMYDYGRVFPILNPRAETLGLALSILYDVASPERARTITESNPTTPFGSAIFFQQIADMPPYHNNSLWPWVGAYWALANAKAGNEDGTMEAIGAVFRPAALFATNKENFVLDNGDIATELNSSNMLWCLAGNLAITNRLLFGINFEADGLAFKPFVPEALAGTRTLDNFHYRNATLSITVSGYGSRIASFKLNGKEHKPFIPASIKGKNTIEIVMEPDTTLPRLKVNRTPNVKAPLTPITWIADGTLHWNPIEYIGSYRVLRDGKEVATTRQTSYPATEPGLYQVIGISADGVESFASEPRSSRPALRVEPAAAATTLSSAEVSYSPAAAIEGYTGAGFAELDRTSAPLTFTVDIPERGTYALTARYANGNGPVNTENKCAIRTLSIDGKRTGVLVMPQRGVANWNDWGNSNFLTAPLTAGRHTLTIDFRPENENMNIGTNHAIVDCLLLERIGQ
ncbi:MAG: hypothetical protein NC418_00005 [Muribaculaceae bacterium]|nr:hypothetical protein [Muribaculaceae bacterium]